MTPDRWQQVEELYHAALERDESERAAFLQRESADDPELCREVESLLSYEGQAREFGETPAWEVAAQGLAEAEVNALLGHQFGSYHVISLLGTGGMGEVYLAKDRSLERNVALKFLPHVMELDETARKRFLREAKSAAALDHPFVCSVFEVGEGQGRSFIAMEYVEGETLKSKLDQGPLPLKEALRISTETAEALEEAHSHKIVHRDLKPSNIMLTRSGHVKVMDFGLAKRVARDQASKQEETLTGLTREGSTFGTVPYMSPEQVRGQAVDTRSDIFSFGVVLYEMLAGEHPFKRPEVMETASAILKDEPPPLTRYREEISEVLQHIVGKMLAKEADQRYQSMHEVRTDLSDLASVPSVTQPSVRGGRRWFSSGWPVVLGLAGALVATLSWIYLKAPESTPPPSAVEIEFRQVTFLGNVGQAQLSPDGHFLAYSTVGKNETSLWVQDLAGGSALDLFNAQAIWAIRWSPDNSRLLFSGRDSGGQSFAALIPRLGGEIQIMPWLPHVAWSPDGESFAGTFRNKSPIRIVNVSSGEVEREIKLEGDYLFVAGLDWSSQGDRLLLNTKSQYQQGIWLVGPDDSRQEQVFASKAVDSPLWSRTGQDIYFLDANPTNFNPVGDLWKVDLQPGQNISSDPVRLVTGAQMSGPLSVSENGETLAYVRKQEWGHYWVGNLQAGKMKDVRQLTQGNLSRVWGSLSPGSESLVYSQSDPTRQALNLFVMSIEGGDSRQLTFLDCDAHSPAWSPDGRWIAFSSDCGGKPQVWRVPVGGGAARPFQNTEVGQFVLYWAPSREIFYLRPGNRNFHILNPETEEEDLLVADDSVGWMFDAQPSPDGKKVAVFWNRQDDAADGIYVINRQDGSSSLLSEVDAYPRGWSPNGQWIYASEYAGVGNSESSWIRVSVSDGTVEQLATPPEGSLLAGITQDTKRALYLTRESQSDVWLAKNFDPEVAELTDR